MKIHSMLPFLDKNEIDTLIDEVVEKKVDLELFNVLPFADEEKISLLMDSLAEFNTEIRSDNPLRAIVLPIEKHM